MPANNPSTPASQALRRSGGGALLLLRRMAFINIGARDLKPTISREALPRAAA